MAATAVSRNTPESHRLDPAQVCLYDFIQAHELLLTIFITAIQTRTTSGEAGSIWKRLSATDRTFHALSKDFRITFALIQGKVEIPAAILLRSIPIRGSETIIEEAWKAKHARMISQFWNSKGRSFYGLWVATLPEQVRSMVTSIDMSVSRKLRERPTFNDFVNIAIQMPLIEKLILRRCSFVDDRCLEWIAIKAPYLKVLDLHSCGLISNRGLIALLCQACHLEQLNLTGCRQIGADGLAAIGLFGIKIRKLYLSDTRIYHYNLQQILAPRGEQLELLDLSQCAYVSIDSMTLVAAHCKNLKTLILDACVGINERSLLALSEGCPQLESISLSICPNLSYRGVRELLLSKPCLQSLSIHYCSFSDEECHSLELEFPHVKIHWRSNFHQPSHLYSSSIR